MPATKATPTPDEPAEGAERTARPAAARTGTSVPPKERAKADAKERERRKEEKRVRSELGLRDPSPSWWAPVMVTLMVIGLVWVVVYYVSQGELPIKSIHAWNLAVGFAFMIAGFAMTTRWT